MLEFPNLLAELVRLLLLLGARAVLVAGVGFDLVKVVLVELPDKGGKVAVLEVQGQDRLGESVHVLGVQIQS